MKKAFPLILVLIGAALVITAVVFWIDSSTSAEPESFGKSLRDWITLILGIGASIKGWIDFLKKEKTTDISPESSINISGNKMWGKNKITIRRDDSNVSDNAMLGENEILVGHVVERLAGDSTIDAPPPKSKKKRKKQN